jgi:hypothetical protein
MITVEKTVQQIHITISKDAMPEEELNAFIDSLRLEEIAQRSRLSEQDADRIADDLKAQWWSQNIQRFIPPNEP